MPLLTSVYWGESLIPVDHICFIGVLKNKGRDFPGGPVVNTSPSSAGHVGSIPGRGAKIPHALWPKKPKHKTEGML